MAARQSSQYVASTMRRGGAAGVDAAELARALEVIRAAGYGAAHVNGNGNGAGVAGGASFRGGNGD